MKLGQYIGLQDQLLHDIHVGDTLTDANGVQYTVDRFGRAKPLDGSNERPVRRLVGCEVIQEWEPAAPKFTENDGKVGPAKPEKTEEEKELDLIDTYVHASGDQRLVDELRSRGWTVTCARTIEKIVYEEVSL